MGVLDMFFVFFLILIRIDLPVITGDRIDWQSMDPFFDPSKGYGRSKADCVQRLPGQDEVAREAQKTMYGGPVARINSRCNYELWKAVREEFLGKAWNLETDDFSYYLLRQNQAVVNRTDTFFEDLCIGCAEKAMMECSSANECRCWRGYEEYVRVVEIECRIKPGDFCVVNSKDVLCVQDAYCDKDLKTCLCTTRPGNTCSIGATFVLSLTRILYFIAFITIL